MSLKIWFYTQYLRERQHTGINRSEMFKTHAFTVDR